MNERSNAYLAEKPLGSLMRQYSVPCIISLVVAALYNIVDQLFIANASYFAVRCFRTYLCMMVLATVNKGTFIYLQALGKAFASMAISMVREIIFGVALPILLPLWFGLNGVLYSFPAADVLTFILAAVIIIKTYRQLGERDGREAASHRTAGAAA